MEGGSICSCVDATVVCCCKERPEPEGEALNLPISQRPSSVGTTCGQWPKNEVAKMSFLRWVAGLSLRDRVRGSDIQQGFRVEMLLLHIKRNQLRGPDIWSGCNLSYFLCLSIFNIFPIPFFCWCCIIHALPFVILQTLGKKWLLLAALAPFQPSWLPSNGREMELKLLLPLLRTFSLNTLNWVHF